MGSMQGTAGAHYVYRKIFNLCKEQGMTVTDFRKKKGFPNCMPTLWFWGHGIDKNRLWPVTDYFDVSYEWLIDDVDEQEPGRDNAFEVYEGFIGYIDGLESADERNAEYHKIIRELEEMRGNLGAESNEEVGEYDGLIKTIKSRLKQ